MPPGRRRYFLRVVAETRPCQDWAAPEIRTRAHARPLPDGVCCTLHNARVGYPPAPKSIRPGERHHGRSWSRGGTMSGRARAHRALTWLVVGSWLCAALVAAGLGTARARPARASAPSLRIDPVCSGDPGALRRWD